MRPQLHALPTRQELMEELQRTEDALDTAYGDIRHMETQLGEKQRKRRDGQVMTTEEWQEWRNKVTFALARRQLEHRKLKRQVERLRRELDAWAE